MESNRRKIENDRIFYIFEKNRLSTFNENWKELKGFSYCTPVNFAAAGFYNYSSKLYPDAVKCFACQKELSDWEKEDDPWSEHLKRGANCPFINFKKKQINGLTTVQDFIELYFELKKLDLSDAFEKAGSELKDKEKNVLKCMKKFKNHK